jgi:hypothetical protein
VEVAEAPITTTSDVSVGYTSKLSEEVENSPDPPLPVASAPQLGRPLDTLSTCPVLPIPSFVSAPAAEAYKISPTVYEDWPVPPAPAERVLDALTTPEEFVTSVPDGAPEIVRLEVEAVPK